MKIKADTVTALAATFTAVAALAVAVWDNVETRAYNRLSVSPHLTIDQTVRDSGGRSYLVGVRNAGVGPALVQRVRVRLDRPDGAVESADWQNLVNVLRDAGHAVTGSWVFSQGDAIGVGDQYFLVQIAAGEGADGPSVPEILNDLGIEIVYESIYGDEWTVQYNWSGEP